jgi:hypothetical protein
MDRRKLKDEDIDFSMDTTPYKTGNNPTWIKATLSKTLIPFHGVLIFSIKTIQSPKNNCRNISKENKSDSAIRG